MTDIKPLQIGKSGQPLHCLICDLPTAVQMKGSQRCESPNWVPFGPCQLVVAQVQILKVLQRGYAPECFRRDSSRFSQREPSELSERTHVRDSSSVFSFTFFSL